MHHDVDDSFYLVRGQLAMRCGDDTFSQYSARRCRGKKHGRSSPGAEQPAPITCGVYQTAIIAIHEMAF